MTRFDILIGGSVLLLTAVGFYWLSIPSVTYPWPDRVAGYSLSPLGAAQDPSAGEQPSIESLRADLALLASRAIGIRTYSVDGVFAQVPVLAAAYDLKVTLGATLGTDPSRNLAQLRALQKIAAAQENVQQVVLGNEILLESRGTVADLQRLLDHARRRIGVPVSTAEPWHIWLQNPSLAEHVDFLMVHFLPYWEGVHVAHAVPLIASRMKQLRKAFPGKRIVIGEVGWPSAGRTRQHAVASADVQARFLSDFLAHAERANYEYFLMEAFDQPWKWSREGQVGAHWGVFDAYRSAKVDFATGARVEGASWRLWVFFNVLFLILLAALRQDSDALTRGGRIHLCVFALLTASLVAAVGSQLLAGYWNAAHVLLVLPLMCMLLCAAVLLLCEAHEWAEARWLPSSPWVAPLSTHLQPLPMVSVHVPICNEPAQMVLDTLQSLAMLDYEHFEVVVVDNNTRDRCLWFPVQQACQALGERFKFVHRDSLPGFKAGALNLALRCSDRQAQVIAVIDADYQVKSGWLRDLVGYFADPDTDIVQAPQDYRDGYRSAFKTLCMDEYSGFFKTGMIVRDRRNAIIQHGTMTLVRRQALQRITGWAQWSITEDAELGLRVLASGGRARYVPESYGQGLTPDNFLDYKRQRFRWALGAVQILRAHANVLSGARRSALSRGQRFHFVAGWLPWLADGASLVCTLLALALTWLMHYWPHWFELPVVSLCAVPIVLFATRACKHVHLYRACVRLSWLRTFGAGLAAMALMPTAGLASIFGVLGLRRDFLRTPKCARRQDRSVALISVGAELCLLAGLGIAIACGLPGSAFAVQEIVAWRAMLVVMAMPFASAILVALIGVLPERSKIRDGTLIAATMPPGKH